MFYFVHQNDKTGSFDDEKINQFIAFKKITTICFPHDTELDVGHSYRQMANILVFLLPLPGHLKFLICKGVYCEVW